MTAWIDLHTHLDKLEEGPDEALRKAREAGVRKLVTIGTEPQDLPVVLEFSRKYAPDVYCTLGIHPHEGAVYTEEIGRFIETHAVEPGVIAVGEIGLDYYYQQSPQAEQRAAFRAQLDIAARLKMPIEIHTRDAEPDTVEILGEYRGRVNGIVHCFTGTQWLAEKALDLGYNISISGIVTFKNAEELRNVVRYVPLDRLHVETDAPFLAPVPMRGKQNTPAYVVHTAKFVAGLKNVSEEQLAEATRDNALKMFPKIQW